MIARASGRLARDPSLEPLPFLSLASLREVITMGGRFTLIAYNDIGNARLALPIGIMIAAAAMLVLVVMLVRAILNGEY